MNNCYDHNYYHNNNYYLDINTDHSYNKKSYISKSKPSKSFFGSTASRNNDEDVYDFDFNETEEAQNTDYSTKSNLQKSDLKSSKSSKSNSNNSNGNSGETAMEKAQNMLNKYGKGGNGKSGIPVY